MHPNIGPRLISGRHPRRTTTCRETAVAGPIPDGTSPTDLVGTGAKSMGQLPADSLLAVPTRAYQSGGALIHALPARRAHTARPPPPAHHRLGQVAAATPASRPFVLASLRALRLDPGAPTPAPGWPGEGSASAAHNKITQHLLTGPFHTSAVLHVLRSGEHPHGVRSPALCLRGSTDLYPSAQRVCESGYSDWCQYRMAVSDRPSPMRPDRTWARTSDSGTHSMRSASLGSLGSPTWTAPSAT
jgi:hypothetical protein